jgi:hypothetical protein
MTDRPASWRMPTPKQMEKLAAAVGKEVRRTANLGPGDPIPQEYWETVLGDAFADVRPAPPGGLTRTQRLSEISQHVLRVACARCDRTVEIQRLDAIRLYGRDAIWKQVGERLLDNTCQNRSGRHEEDGCWPSFE